MCGPSLLSEGSVPKVGTCWAWPFLLRQANPSPFVFPISLFSNRESNDDSGYTYHIEKQCKQMLKEVIAAPVSLQPNPFRLYEIISEL